MAALCFEAIDGAIELYRKTLEFDPSFPRRHPSAMNDNHEVRFRRSAGGFPTALLRFRGFARVQVFGKEFNHGNRRLYAILCLAETVAFVGEKDEFDGDTAFL